MFQFNVPDRDIKPPVSKSYKIYIKCNPHTIWNMTAQMGCTVYYNSHPLYITD